MSVQNCSTCRNWELCRGSMQIGVDCYKPTKEEIIRQELMKSPKVKAEFSKNDRFDNPLRCKCGKSGY